TMTIYYPATGDVLSSNPMRAGSVTDFRQPAPSGWTYTIDGDGTGHSGQFVLRLNSPEQGGAVTLEAAFPAENIRKMLDAFKRYGDPFLYHPSGRLITNYDADSVTIHTITRRLQELEMDGRLSTVTELNGQSYLLNSVPSASTG